MRQSLAHLAVRLYGSASSPELGEPTTGGNMKAFMQGQAIVGLALACCQGISFAQPQQIFLVPHHADYECSVGKKKDGTVEFCGSTKLVVQIVQVVSVAGVVTGCLAVMPYNKLTIYFDRTGTTTGKLTWVLPSSLPLDASVKWAEDGVAVLAESGKARKKTFADDGAIAGMEFTIPLRDPQSNPPAQPVRKLYNHLPTVSYKTSAGVEFECLGVDPIIINSEN
jgi:hypothetical protein